MTYKADPTLIAELWQLLDRRISRPSIVLGRGIIARLAAEGWAGRADVDDLLRQLFPSATRPLIDSLLDAFEVRREVAYHRPSRLSGNSFGFESVRVCDLAALLIELEALGCAVDPSPLAEVLEPSLASAKLLSWSEMRVLLFRKERHRRAPLAISAAGAGSAPAARTTKVQLPTGHTAELAADEDGTAIGLVVRSPGWRRKAPPVQTTCAECGLEYWKGDPDESDRHRKEHRKRMRVLAPSPSPYFGKALGGVADPELVTTDSPRWKHREMYERAAQFRREFRYDFVQWGSPQGDDDASVQGFLLQDDTGAFAPGTIIGACAFRFNDARWCLDWVWLCPAARRRGVLSRRWDHFRDRFGQFELMPPLSQAMQAFAAKHGAGKPA